MSGFFKQISGHGHVVNSSNSTSVTVTY